MPYRIEALPLAPFQPLFILDDAALAAIGARRMIADRPNSAPCRVSLVDAEPGETLILVHHDHVTDPTSPYRQGGPVFVREKPSRANPSSTPCPTNWRAGCCPRVTLIVPR